MRTPENYEKETICKFLESIDAWFCKPTTFGYGKSGVPDIIANVQGRFIAIEVKREGKVPTPIQKRRIQDIRNKKGLALWGTAEKVLSELKFALGLK